ncbi:MAG: glycosyltransferase family 4 protein [Actinomycetota bacterium]
MRVGLVCPYDWSHPGGVRTHIEGLSAALERAGVEVEILAPSSRPEPQIFWLGRTVGIPANGSIARLCFSPSARRRLQARIARGDLDLLHLHEPAAPSTSLLALTLRPPAVVATFHAARDRSLAYLLARPALRPLFRRIDERIAVSTAARALVAAHFPGRYRLIPNGVDSSRFRGAAPDPELASLKPFVLFVGRNERRKGFEVARAAVRQLRRRLDVRLVAAGIDGEPQRPWEVRLGAVSHERLPGIYAAADVFCAPNLGRESFGIVLLEAMAAGAPVVCSDLPGFREAAGDVAWYAAPNRPGEFADRLADALTDEPARRRMSLRGQQRAAEFDWERLALRVLETYTQAVARPPGRP